MKKVKTLVVNDFRSSLKSKKEFSEFVYWCARESKQTKIQVEFNENELDLLSKFCRFMDDCLVYSFTKKYVFENLDIIINISITEDYDENKMYDYSVRYYYNSSTVDILITIKCIMRILIMTIQYILKKYVILLKMVIHLINLKHVM